MYNLIVTSDETAWEGKSYLFPQQRFGEYTDDYLKNRYSLFNEDSITELTSIFTLFAYEQFCQKSARIGQVTNIIPRGKNIKIEYSLLEGVQSISPSTVSDLLLDLDIDGWEMNRTHWAMKDVDLVDALKDHGIIIPTNNANIISTGHIVHIHNSPRGFEVYPTVFNVPEINKEEDLVSIMMPFSKEFDEVRLAIETVCKQVGLRCERADDIWDNSTIIQDIVNLIYRSSVVVVDFTGRNPNVMYETGIAHTIGRTVIPISQSYDDLPFDLAHHRTLKYLPNEEGFQNMIKVL